MVLDHILLGDRFDSYATHLSHADKTLAKSLARNQFDQLRIRLRTQLDVAYGIAPEPRDAIDRQLSADEQLKSLDPTFSPRPPVGADFKGAFEALLGQLFAHQFPAHPEFDTEIKPAVIRSLWPEVQAAAEAPGYRSHVKDQSLRRRIRSVVNPCRLGQMGETHLLLDPHWASHFGRCHAADGGGTVTVAKLRQWIDTPTAMGLPRELQNLLILAWAAMSNRRFSLRGGPADAGTDQMADELELVEQALPPAADWQAAVRRASTLFGVTLPQSLNAANVGRAVVELGQAARARRDAIQALVGSLRDRCERYAPGPSGARLSSAESLQSLLASMLNADGADLVSTVANAALGTAEAAAGRAMAEAAACTEALSRTRWEVMDALRSLQDQRAEAAQGLLTRLADLLQADEHVLPLKARLAEIERDALRLLTVAADPPPAPPPAAPQPMPPLDSTLEDVEVRDQVHLRSGDAARVLDSLKRKLAEDAELELTLSWRLQRRTRGH